MHRHKLCAALTLAGLLGAALPAHAAPPANDTLQKLLERMERLEERNAQLEKEVRALRQEKESVEQSLSSERISEQEPEIATRLKAVEQDVQAMKKPVALARKLDGIAVDAALTTVWQKADGLPHGADSEDKLNYRADLSVEVPLEPIGAIEHKLFAHLRFGQGQGLNEPLGYLGHLNVPNSAAFQASGASADDSVAILGQAWYQASIPLDGAGSTARQKLELTFGKIDIFGFFDQNNAAGDETTQFLNAVFVHNPLLDAGGEVGADANGFQPGVIASYLNERNGSEPWRLSLGLFDAGDKSSNYQETADSPLVIAQAEKTLKLFDGRTGNYRLYAWTRKDVPHFTEATSGRHTGIGISIDQQLGDSFKLFGRYGQLVSGKLPAKRALALGTEIRGNYWGRAGDAVGIAGSWMWASKAYKRAGGEGYLNQDSFEADPPVPDFSFTPSGAERVAEIYYRYYVSPQFSISPDVQWIKRGGANPDADTVTIYGLRANIAY
jgi:uncharacterized protein (UPF0335 family)